MAPAAALMDELVELILLRIPPDDPARLLRPALVCKQWGRIASDPGFRRQFAEFHRTPPMLGLLCSRVPWGPVGSNTIFVSTTSFRPSPACLKYTTVDARHGRVLLKGASGNPERKLWGHSFVVWDPIAGGERAKLPLLPTHDSTTGTWNAAVLCASAAAAEDNACDHLDCHSGPFLVIFVARGSRWGSGISAHVYSSEAGAWSQRIYAPRLVEGILLEPSVLAGNSMYFLCTKSVLKFALATREMSLIDRPQETQTFECTTTILRTTEDGGLGLATLCSDGLYLWSREFGPDEDVVWAQSKVIKLRKLLPDVPLCSLRLASFAHGLNVILVGSSKGIFSVNLKSVQATKVHGKECWDMCFPYMSFYTPALGAAASAE